MTRRQRIVCLDSPAKLNLGLLLTGRRPDGYHLLESLFWPIGLMDRLEIRRGEALDVDAHWAADCPLPGEEIPQGRENLVYGCLKATGLGAASIEKRIPMGGGLGGGSSNAGAVVRYALKQRLLSEAQATAIALGAGADVSFFLQEKPAWVSGIGEKVAPLRITSEVARTAHFLLVLLPTPTPTKQVFETYKQSGRGFSASRNFDASEEIGIGEFRKFLQSSGNDLEAAACFVNPLIAETLFELRKIPSLYTGLSGSGSTCFSVFDGATARDAAAKEIEPFLRKRRGTSVRTETYVPSGSDN